ncbi:hypothetical protein VCHENC02_5241, partial [Vibrio harveyi]
PMFGVLIQCKTDGSCVFALALLEINSV